VTWARSGSAGHRTARARCCGSSRTAAPGCRCRAARRRPPWPGTRARPARRRRRSGTRSAPRCVQVHEQLVAGVDDLGDPGVGPVHLVDDQDHGEAGLQGLRSTNLVCGSGPSLASTSSTTPSTMDRPRSTSPPKSAWRGVDDVDGQPAVLDGGVLGQDRDALLALQVAGVEHPVGHLGADAEAPDCQSMASTRVVLPWSTCATMATLRRSSRVASGRRQQGMRGGSKGSKGKVPTRDLYLVYPQRGARITPPDPPSKSLVSRLAAMNGRVLGPI